MTERIYIQMICYIIENIFGKKNKLNTGCLMIGDAYLWGTLLIKYVDQMKIRNTCIASHKNISETIFMIQLPQ